VIRLTSKALWFAALMTGASVAKATPDLCRFAPFLPSYTMNFERAAQGIDGLGCNSEPTNSAHTKRWTCGSGEDQVTVALFHLVQESVDVIMFRGPSTTTLEGFRNCRRDSFAAVPRRRSSVGAAPLVIEDDLPFEPASILVQERMDVGESYGRRVQLMGFERGEFIIAGNPDTDLSSNSPARIVEQALFGVSRRSYASTSVEIAGRNLYSSSASAIVRAFQSRGSTITRDATEGGLHTVVLTAPVGLEGVSRIEVESTRRHTMSVAYFLSGVTEYTTFTGLLDGRYGRSTVVSGTGAERACRRRSWSSGAASILGEFCPNTGYRIMFLNEVVLEQINAAANHRPPPAQRRRIDPDNF
jgi:hypothetical protein